MAVKKVTLSDGSTRWRLRLYTGRDETGKQEIVVKTYDRKKDADGEETRLKGLMNGGIPVVATKETLAVYLRRWLNDVMKGRIRPRTWDDYSRTLARYVEDPPKDAPQIGKLRLDRVTHGAIQALYGYLQGQEGLSPRTVRSLHAVLRQGLQHATVAGIVGRNAADLVELPRQDKRKVEAMSQKEAAAFLEKARADRYHALWCVLLTGGLRPGEALALTWPDVDMDEGRVRVERTLTRRGLDPEKHPSRWALVEPKTDRARRTVPLPPFTMKALKEWRAVQGRERLLLGGEYEDNGLVFSTEFGRPLDGANLYARNYRRIMEAAKLGTQPVDEEGKKKGPFQTKYRLYDLRHSAATLLLRQGVHPKIVSERLGHASVAFTLDVYSASLPDMQVEAVTRMEAMFGAGS